jgi:hypothetical protein
VGDEQRLGGSQDPAAGALALGRLASKVEHGNGTVVP